MWIFGTKQVTVFILFSSEKGFRKFNVPHYHFLTYKLELKPLQAAICKCEIFWLLI
jgi:hypothetical protein